MKRRNANFGFLPLGWKASPLASRKERARRRAEWKRRVGKRVREMRAEYARLSKSARAGYPAKRKLEQLFHEVYGPGGMTENPPRRIPEVTDEQVGAFEKLIRGNAMAQKKRKSKKKNSRRRGVMPPGLKRYMAEQRAKKRAKKNPRRRKAKRRTPKVRVRTRTIVKYKYRTRTVKVKTKRRKRRNPPKRSGSIRIQAPRGLTGKGLQQFRRMAARAYGAPARIVKG